MTALHEIDDLTCPRCGTSLAELGETIAADVTAVTEQLRVDVECPECEAPLAIVVESALPEALGVYVWIEDRRDGIPDE